MRGWGWGGGRLAESDRGSFAVEVMVRVPVCAVLWGLALTFTVTLCPGDRVIGIVEMESVKTPFEIEMPWMVTDC